MASLKAGDGNLVFRKRCPSHIKHGLLAAIALPLHGPKVSRLLKPDQAGAGGSGNRLNGVAKPLQQNNTTCLLGTKTIAKNSTSCACTPSQTSSAAQSPCKKQYVARFHVSYAQRFLAPRSKSHAKPLQKTVHRAPPLFFCAPPPSADRTSPSTTVAKPLQKTVRRVHLLAQHVLCYSFQLSHLTPHVHRVLTCVPEPQDALHTARTLPDLAQHGLRTPPTRLLTPHQRPKTLAKNSTS